MNNKKSLLSTNNCDSFCIAEIVKDERSPMLIKNLLEVWQASVRASHHRLYGRAGQEDRDALPPSRQLPQGIGQATSGVCLQ